MRIGIMSPGEMDHRLGQVLTSHGAEVWSCLEGRSDRTRQQALLAGFKEASTIPDLVETCDVILSVVVPGAAKIIAEKVSAAMAAAGRSIYFADLNAISPMTAKLIGVSIENAGGRFVDGAIIGASTKLENGTAIYCSGQYAHTLAFLSNHGLRVEVLGPKVGQASAFKMIYAGFTKGAVALLLELFLAAEKLGLTEEIEQKYRENYAGIIDFFERTLPGLPFRAKRRAEEMTELYDMIKTLGLEGTMTAASEQVLDRVAEKAAYLEREYGSDEVEKWEFRHILAELAKD